MKRIILKSVFVFAGVAALAACSTSDGKDADQGSRPPVAVEVVPLNPGTLSELVDVVGTLVSKREALVKTEYSGVVSDVYVTEWSPVSKGQPLARLDTREADAALLQVKAHAQQALREYERAIKLKQAGLMTQQGLEASETERDAAQAGLTLAQARFDKAVIRAPMDGVIADRGVYVGSYVENMGAAPMFRIVDNRIFDLDMNVPSSKIHFVSTGQTVTFTTDAVPGKTFDGKVAFINPAADASSRTIQVRAEVPNVTGELKSGLFVKGTILCGVRANVLMVPRTALLAWNLRDAGAELFVLEGDVARRRSVGTGATSNGEVEITQGVAQGDRVVTRGAFELQDGDMVVAE